ncbi:hypothetical protein LENED_011700 [Lentinula edodes]|uniref:Uncharacterized protein n=1 Tax=Lentinula edodes TaxID=5353 RepID=A0A1Q3EQQ8_LENED|nr:hypothetical protein LENED_011700 [Lentinula edodes]
MVGQKITTTSIASPGVKTGVMQLQVSESGSYQATLTMMFQGKSVSQTAQFIAALASVTTTSSGQTNAIGFTGPSTRKYSFSWCWNNPLAPQLQLTAIHNQLGSPLLQVLATQALLAICLHQPHLNPT